MSGEPAKDSTARDSTAKHSVGLLDLATRLPAVAMDAPVILRGALTGLLALPTSKTSIGKVFQDRAARHGDRVFIRFGEQKITYRHANETANRYAAVLADRGVRRGQVVGIMLRNSPDAVLAMLAVVKCGAVAGMLNYHQRGEVLAHSVGLLDATVLVAESDLVKDIVDSGAEVADLLTVENLAELADGKPAGNPPSASQVQAKDPAFYIFTSGTTGHPKGAVLTHSNLAGQTMTAIYTNPPHLGHDIGFIGVPLFHIAGIGNVLPAITLGATTVIYPLGAFNPGDLLDVLEAEKVTGLFLVPAQWQAVCAEQQARPRVLQLRTLSWGAAPASETLLRQMNETFPGCNIVAAFGQTEMSPVTAMLLGEDAVRKIGSVGKVVPTVAARIVDENMRDVPIGEVGEIVYRAPTLMAGYWNNPKATAEAFAGGWFHSGDLVRSDDEGYIWVVDRKKDMIISGGENVYCAEVENSLAAHPAIIEVAVIGRADEKWGEVPVAVAAVSEAGLQLADLTEFLNDRLARYKHPKALEIVDALPRNPAGKVVKTELRVRFAGAPKRAGGQ